MKRFATLTVIGLLGLSLVGCQQMGGKKEEKKPNGHKEMPANGQKKG